MYIYLSKKIAIPNNTRINCISWNKEDGFIAVGCEGGLLKVLKLDSGSDADGKIKSKGLTASNNLSMNQTLEGHNDSIVVLTWNQKHQKLTSSDQNGIIIVWMLYKGTWYEEMINNRKKSVVVGMDWSFDGTKICIIYEDGAVIVGSVDGNRLWGKELKNIPLAKVQWSPDAKLLLFGLRNGQVHLYDNLGNFIMPVEMLSLKVYNAPTENAIVGMDWYNGMFGHVYVLCPTIVVCYENGYMQLMCNESDTNSILVETRLVATYCCWNHNGSLIAVTGKQHSDGKNNNVIQFYSTFGEHIRTLKLPGLTVSSCSWEEGSLRIAIGIESSVYFANIRPDYKWCYFKNTIVFTSCRLQKGGVCISFWDLVTNQCHTKFVPVLIAMAACEDYCVLVTRLDTDNPMGKYGLLLCNTLGTPVDGKYTDIEVKFVAMNSTHVAAASKNNYFLWQYKTPKSSVSLKDVVCQIHHVDYDPTGAMHVMKDLKVSVDDIPLNGKADSLDPVCCLALSEKFLIIGKESGILKQYKVPRVIIINTYTLPVQPNKILLNCNSTRLSIIDMAGVLTVLDITENALQSTETENRLERRDVWAMCWASDNPQLLAIMEKTRMYIFKGIYPEEPISSAGYIYSFQNLEIQAVLLDEVMETPEKPSREHLFKLEVKSLRDTRQLLEKVGIKEAALFIEDNPHPRLWHLLGQAALKDLNLKIAEDAFVRSADYVGIQFIKKLKAMTNDAIKKASTAAYFKNFDEAEKIYVEEDRLDLALNLRKTLGDWFRVIQLIKNGGVAAPDQTLENAYNRTADYFTHINNWSAALEYYGLAKNKNKICDSYIHLQDYEALEQMIDQLEERDLLLKQIATVFTLAGDYVPAIKAYLKLGDLESAIEVSIINHQWDQAINIAKTYRLHQISDLFVEYSDHLVKEGKINRAVEINVQARYWFTAAKHAMEMADVTDFKINKDPVNMKKMYVYAARLIELHKADPNSEEKVDAVISVDLLENHWKGAEAYHFYLLAHRQLYFCHTREAMCTLYKLQNYLSYISAEEVYKLLALAAYFSSAYSLCSEMFVKLQSLPEISVDVKGTYKELSARLFTSKEPINAKNKHYFCANCHSTINHWRTFCPECETQFLTCIASGCPIMPGDTGQKVCSTCHHIVLEKHLGLNKICPLCHSRFE